MILPRNLHHARWLIFGVVICAKADSGRKGRRWKCLFDSCRNEKILSLATSSTGNVTKHLKRAHGIESVKTEKTRANKAAHQRTLEASMCFRNRSPQRFYKIFVSKMIITDNQPISFGTNNNLHVLVNYKKFPKLNLTMFKRAVVEMHSYVRGLMKKELKAVKKLHDGPSFRLCVDLYSDELQSVKYLGIRVSFTNFRVGAEVTGPIINPYRGYNLAIRPFNPTPARRGTKRVSQLLANWAEEVFVEFGLSA